MHPHIYCAQNGDFMETLLQVKDRVSGDLVDQFVVPNVRVETPLSGLELATGEEVTWQLILAVLLEDVDARDEGAGGNHRRVVLHEARFVDRGLKDPVT